MIQKKTYIIYTIPKNIYTLDRNDEAQDLSERERRFSLISTIFHRAISGKGRNQKTGS